MKRIWLQKIAFLLFSSLVCFATPYAVQAQVKPPAFEIGQKFQAEGLNFPANTYIVDVQQGDVTGDAANDTVLLVGQKENPNDTRYSQLNVVVRDGKTGKFSALNDQQTKGYLSGYEPKLFLGDFIGDKLKDTMVTVATGGSGGVYSHLIATWKNNKPAVIFGEKENQGVKIKGKFLDGFKAELTSETLQKTFIVDVSAFKKSYVEGKIYSPSGKYIYQDSSEYQIFSDPFSSLIPVDNDNDGVYELAGEQYVWGPAHIYGVTDVDSIWKYQRGKWVPIDVKYIVTLLLQ